MRFMQSLVVSCTSMLTCWIFLKFGQIPADMVANAIIVAAMAHANQSGSPRIYQVGSSVKNPTTLTTLHEVAYRYFKRHPWINKDGKPVIVGHVRVLGSMASFKRYLTLHYLLPLKVFTTNLLQLTTDSLLSHKIVD